MGKGFGVDPFDVSPSGNRRSPFRKIIAIDTVITVLLTIVTVGIYLAAVSLTHFHGIMYWVVLVAVIAVAALVNLFTVAIFTAVIVAFMTVFGVGPFRSRDSMPRFSSSRPPADGI